MEDFRNSKHGICFLKFVHSVQVRWETDNIRCTSLFWTNYDFQSQLFNRNNMQLFAVFEKTSKNLEFYRKRELLLKEKVGEAMKAETILVKRTFTQMIDSSPNSDGKRGENNLKPVSPLISKEQT
jgi:hypothetical protein